MKQVLAPALAPKSKKTSASSFRSEFLAPQALFTFQKILQNFSDSPSHRIFRGMHEALNIDENKK